MESFFSFDNTEIFYRKWDNVSNPKAVVHIIHGMVEHIGRYDDFAKFLNDNNYIVYGLDSRGHGKTGQVQKRLGDFGDNIEWEDLIEDLEHLLRIEESENDLPIYILGHSMGSFMARDFINLYGSRLNGAIIMGTGKADSINYLAVRLLTIFLNLDNEAKFIHSQAFGSFNSGIKTPRTKNDWLSRDPREVDKYENDPLCGSMVTNRFYKVFMRGMKNICKKEKMIKLDKEFPILFVSGLEDPVGNRGIFVEDIYKRYRKSGLKNVKLKLFPKMRHEILNEIDNEIVYFEILNFFNKNIV